MKQKLYTTDEIILMSIKEKHNFETHKDDISYACHHMKVWLHVDMDELKNKFNDKTITLTQLKRIIDKQFKKIIQKK